MFSRSWTRLSFFAVLVSGDRFHLWADRHRPHAHGAGVNGLAHVCRLEAGAVRPLHSRKFSHATALQYSRPSWLLPSPTCRWVPPPPLNYFLILERKSFLREFISVDCVVSSVLAYIRVAAALCVLTLVTDLIATLLTGLGLRSNDHRTKYKYYRVAVYIMILSCEHCLFSRNFIFATKWRCENKFNNFNLFCLQWYQF